MPWILLLGVSAAILVAGVVTFVTHDSTMPEIGDVAAEIELQVAECRRYATNEWNDWNQGEIQYIDPGYEEYLSQFETAEAMVEDQCNPRYFEGGYVHDPRFCLISLYDPNVGYRQSCPDFEEGEVFVHETHTLTIDGEEYRTLLPIPGGIVPGTSLLLFAVAAIVGASFIGAEYKSGTIETTLLWEPRRVRVLGSKLGAVGLSAFVIHVSLLGLLVLVMLPAAVWRGSTVGVDSDFWLGVLGVVLRGGVSAAAIAAIALSVSVVTRNTVGGVAVMLGYSTVSPMISTTLLKSVRPFDLTENMAAFANSGEVGRFVGEGFDIQAVYSHSVGGAAIRVAVYVAIAITIAVVVFRRRDID
jgi:hypothetical protein